jgi:hypothetical protein
MKMSHELQGTWHLYVVQATAAGGPLRLFPQGTFSLEMPNAQTGAIETGSKHGANDLSGSATRTADGMYSIIINEKLTADATPPYRPHVGFLLDRIDSHGERFLVMAGFRRPVTTTPPTAVPTATKSKAKKGAAVKTLLDGQEEGGWVATKP